MGIIHDVCDFCGIIFADCDDYGYCDGCDRKWCEHCQNNVFLYGTRTVCEMCFSVTNTDVTTERILAYILKEYGEQMVTDPDVLSLFIKNHKIDLDKVRFEVRKRIVGNETYTCQDTTNHDCSGQCTKLSTDYIYDEPNRYHETRAEFDRGVCCKIQEPDDQSQWCSECSKRSKTD